MKILLKFAHFIFLIISVILQLSFLEQLKIFNINIDLVMVTVIGISVFEGGLYGLIYGFIAGMLLDMMIGQVVGLNALIYCLAGFLTGMIMNAGFKRKMSTYMLLIFFFTEASILLTGGIYYLFNYSASTVALGIEMIINPACNIAIMFVIFPLLKAGLERSEEIGITYKSKV